MRCKEFFLNHEKYFIELHEENEIKIYKVISGKRKHLYGKQKQIIINKITEIIENNSNNIFNDNIISYVQNYINGINRDASKNTRYLGRILFMYLSENNK
jgi:ribosome biogenesis protein Nip4